MELKFNIPDYLSIKDWKYLNSLELDSQADKMIKFISYISDIEEEQILKLTPIDLQKTYLSVLETIGETESTFFPVFELDGQLYGYSSISKMTLGEYIDLEKLTKNPVIHLEDIMAILYRPIKKHSFNGIKWAVKSQHKVGIGEVENLFQYYTLEEYNSNTRAEQAEKMKNIPVSFALGAMSFFFSSRNHILSKYKSIFKPQVEGGEGSDEESEQSRFNTHWGWFATICNLAETPILSITGDKAITDLNFPFVLNYLAYQQDKNGIRQREQNRQTQTYKLR
jgi:hypothetical protein